MYRRVYPQQRWKPHTPRSSWVTLRNTIILPALFRAFQFKFLQTQHHSSPSFFMLKMNGFNWGFCLHLEGINRFFFFRQTQSNTGGPTCVSNSGIVVRSWLAFGHAVLPGVVQVGDDCREVTVTTVGHTGTNTHQERINRINLIPQCKFKPASNSR